MSEYVLRSNYKYFIPTPSEEYIPKHNVSIRNENKESGTQTSKTILQLAKLELGDMSPDSLSPTDRKHIQKSPKKEIHFVRKLTPRNDVTFNRKNYVLQYINSNYQAPDVKNSANNTDKLITEKLEKKDSDFSRSEAKSLTETFLEKARIKQHNDFLNSYDLKMDFLQQTSPLKKILNKGDNQLTSQSCIGIEEFSCKAEPKIKKSTYNKSRFTLKNIKQKTPVDSKKPAKYFCQHNLSLTLPENILNETIPSQFSCKDKKDTTFMSPTISSENKNQGLEIKYLNNFISPTRRGSSLSPNRDKNLQMQQIPYIDSTKNEQKIDKNAVNQDQDSTIGNSSMEIFSSTSTDFLLSHAIGRLRMLEWNAALKGLLEIVEICRTTDINVIYPHMTTINQRLLELLRSPRSHVCRTACQAAGHLFEYIKDTRRPEFDDITDSLLCKTADSNKFIRQDANLALDCMVTHIPVFHAVRALCAKGPNHKNYLVRSATARLLVCAMVIAGVDVILNSSGGDSTRKRLILNMVKFVEDKNFETRKLGERMYKLMKNNINFEILLKKYLDKEEKVTLKKNLKTVMNCVR